MSEIIYAIIKEDEKSKLHKISISTNSQRTISDEELCKFHNYATNLYSAYCSCLPKVSVEQSIPNSDLRYEAILFEDAIDQLKNKYKDKLIAYSHRYGGWTTFEWAFNKDIKFIINTNFGFGTNSYFQQSIYYKGVKLAPYSNLITYRYANFRTITSHTYEYNLEYNEWNHLINDSIDFYNAIVEQNDNYIFHWIIEHLEKMVTELEKYINASYCYFDNIIRENNYSGVYFHKSTELVEGDEFWIAKSNKISEALLFIDNIKELPTQVNPSKYITRIRNLNKTFLPKLIMKINELETENNVLEEQVKIISTKMPLSLYIKLYDKYYYSKSWYLNDNKFKMIIFLMRMLRRKSNISIANIKKEINILNKQIELRNKLNEKLSHVKSVMSHLVTDRNKINDFFTPLKNSED